MGNIQCCCSNNNNNINKSPNIFKNTSINLYEIGKDPQSSNEYSEDFEYLTPEEMQKMNDRMEYRINNYKQMPLKSSNIIIYESGIIE